MIRAIIIDDEKNNIENLTGLLELHSPVISVVATATNADEGIAKIHEQHPDLLFLDIQMPGKNGFEVLKSLPHHFVEVIFVTAYDQYGIPAIKFSAIDYLLKPVNIAELKTAVSKAVEKLNQKKQNFQLENLLEMMKNKDEKNEHRLALSTAKQTRFVSPGDIIRCESSNAYTSFYLAGGDTIMVSRPIFEYEELLAAYGFIRCHQSHLVNRKHIKSWLKDDGGYLLMEDGGKVPISRNKKEQVTALLMAMK
ncbi:LytTR family two component transcriptional regulator [Anseongella ginsenosidimutans]|uniref:LytTR family two component transcriptional regulator n=1 Tax=Anseongella ginsenosidimutans TaxID=496056 RepID=A0A4R3KVP2_9SPHI|nr:LytTR family DNA-binding domain-containing protein [Anseongella ginsenosidimutans]TCS89201.1 LytTR family two component transcriptional regulator [Anseongella ginsenosidimutans]